MEKCMKQNGLDCKMKKHIMLIKRSPVREIADIDEVMSQEIKISMHEQTYVLAGEDYPQGSEDNKRFENKMEQPCNFV